MDKVRIGIIGTGGISEFHRRAYEANPGVEITAACDIKEDRVGEYGKKHAIPFVCTDYRELLQRDDVDAVSVTTWNKGHAPISIEALRAGKHVLCEKPLAMNAAQARGMVEAEKESGNLLMVGFVRRFEEGANYLKNRIEQDKFGRIYYAKTGYVRKWGNPGGWFGDSELSGGGPVIDLGVHVIDLIRYITGKPRAVSVSASVFNSLGALPGIKGQGGDRSVDYGKGEFKNDVEDGACAVIRFDNAMTLAFETSWTLHTGSNQNYLNLYGDKGGAQMEPKLELYGVEDDYFTTTSPGLQPHTFEGIFQAEIDHFIDSLQGKCECRCPAQDGLEIMKILDAIYESGRTGKEVIL